MNILKKFSNEGINFPNWKSANSRHIDRVSVNTFSLRNSDNYFIDASERRRLVAGESIAQVQRQGRDGNADTCHL